MYQLGVLKMETNELEKSTDWFQKSAQRGYAEAYLQVDSIR
jgi:TPR repeat protein